MNLLKTNDAFDIGPSIDNYSSTLTSQITDNFVAFCAQHITHITVHLHTKGETLMNFEVFKVTSGMIVKRDEKMIKDYYPGAIVVSENGAVTFIKIPRKITLPPESTTINDNLVLQLGILVILVASSIYVFLAYQ